MHHNVSDFLGMHVYAVNPGHLQVMVDIYSSDVLYPSRQTDALSLDGVRPHLQILQELMMAKAYKLNVKVIVTVNNRLQLVEQVGANFEPTASCVLRFSAGV